MSTAQPVFHLSNVIAVRLLQGAVYATDERDWELIRSSESDLAKYFARLGLLLVVEETDRLAYLRQMTDDELPPDYEALPKLFRRTRLPYGDTLLCVLLREELSRFDEERIGERCVVEAARVFDRWKPLVHPRGDEVAARGALGTSLERLAKQGLVRRCRGEPETWEVLRVLKARLPAAELEALKTRLLAARDKRNPKPEATDE